MFHLEYNLFPSIHNHRKKQLLRRMEFFETIYHDFTVNDKLTISFPKTKLTFKYPSFIDLWIKGEKYRCSYYSLINALENYTKY